MKLIQVLSAYALILLPVLSQASSETGRRYTFTWDRLSIARGFEGDVSGSREDYYIQAMLCGSDEFVNVESSCVHLTLDGYTGKYTATNEIQRPRDFGGSVVWAREKFRDKIVFNDQELEMAQKRLNKRTMFLRLTLHEQDAGFDDLMATTHISLETLQMMKDSRDRGMPYTIENRDEITASGRVFVD